jgi:hypothetical protein
MKSVAADRPAAGGSLENTSALARGPLGDCRQLRNQAGRRRGSPLEDSSATSAALAWGPSMTGISYSLVHLAPLPPLTAINRIAFRCSCSYRQSTGEYP